MKPTEKLYWSDARATSFETRGAALGSYGGKPSVVLAQTMFYPEGGAQLGDLGTLALGTHVVPIADTQIEDGSIHHVIGGPLDPDVAEALASGAAVDLAIRGTVDERHRRDHMVQHTAQHALSRALADAARADTVSARLGATSCTIDVARVSAPRSSRLRQRPLAGAAMGAPTGPRVGSPVRPRSSSSPRPPAGRFRPVSAPKSLPSCAPSPTIRSADVR